MLARKEATSFTSSCEFCVKVAVDFNRHLLDVVAACGLVECASHCFLLDFECRIFLKTKKLCIFGLIVP